MSNLTFNVSAETRSYQNCPVNANLAVDSLPAEPVVLTDNAGTFLPGQLKRSGGNVRIHWIIPITTAIRPTGMCGTTA